MACILNIETATRLCSVVLARNGAVIAARETFEEKSHAAKLTVYIEEVLKETNLSVADLSAVAVGKGPGSYTGLRIGVSVAKGLCYGSGLPLIGLNTLNTMVRHVMTHHAGLVQSLPVQSEIILCPMIDARRMEVFTCLYNVQEEEIQPVQAIVVEHDTFKQYLDNRVMVFFGSGMDKCMEVLSHPHAVFIPDIHPHASSMALLAEENYAGNLFENVAYFEPFYLKDFIATTSKKGLRV
ncbi:MAG: tRNA (adenosine(37)-N6)-threonylcarbamoyltransferase complex dimerization subunit type 1 TsaB [Bacteroidales bacterium]|nr:tRNA (adenosine(37)-N6)-threonylcarbamoyltransferase complex dimerization subunit type 1 TsaB [Bacteroidales bacterium]